MLLYDMDFDSTAIDLPESIIIFQTCAFLSPVLSIYQIRDLWHSLGIRELLKGMVTIKLLSKDLGTMSGHY